MPKTRDAKTPDGARDPVAIKIERCPIGSANIGNDVHFHAVDDGKEVLAVESEVADRRGETAQPRRWRCRQKARRYPRAIVAVRASRVVARAGIIGNIIHRAAE